MDRADIAEALQALDAARAAIAALPFDAMTPTELLRIYEHRAHARREDASIDHTVLATLARTATMEDFGGTRLFDVLAQRLHLDTKDTKRRLADAEQLGPRWAVHGERLDPELPETAAALARGSIDVGHVEVIQKFFKKLPAWIDAPTRAEAERDLAQAAATMIPQDLQVVADHLRELLDPDGAEPDYDDQQAKRSLHVGRQRPDGMTPVKGVLDPRTAALLELVTAKWAPRGENLPADPGAAEALHGEIIGGDGRSLGQRQHDALSTAMAHAVASGELGELNGLPATIIVTTPLSDLEAAAAAHYAGDRTEGDQADDSGVDSDEPLGGESDSEQTGGGPDSDQTGGGPDTDQTGDDDPASEAADGVLGEATSSRIADDQADGDRADRDQASGGGPGGGSVPRPTRPLGHAGSGTGSGYATTAGGTRLSMRDVINLAAHAGHHYLAIFDDHTEEILYLGRAKRCATAAQRLALYARDKGCTRPGCTAPPQRCQAHHGERDWRDGGNTNIDELTLACQPDNNLIERTGWTTRRRNGRTEWIPPPSLDTGQARINNHHHPQRYLTENFASRTDDEPE